MLTFIDNNKHMETTMTRFAPAHAVPLTTLALAIGLLGCSMAQAQAQTTVQAQATRAGNPAYLDPHLSPEQRAADLVSRMTLEEKAAQLGNAAPAIPRLRVPKYNWWNEGLHGVARAGVATVFPQAVGMAATWDEALMQQTGDVIATEFRAKYLQTRDPDGGTDWYRGLTVWSPNINIFRDPRWGRGQETYGEDPYLTSRMGVGFIKGLQGNDPAFFKTIATSKHFAVHSGPESNRHREDIHPSKHDLEDTYLPAFRATVTEAKVDSVMCAYNAVDGVPACANTDLLEAHLRQAWGFKGFVVSDCGAAANIYRQDSLHYTQTPEQAVAAAFKAGMDLICGDYRNGMTTEAGPIANAVRQGLLPQATVDRALQRLFVARFQLGLFDPAPPQAFAAIAPADVDTPAHRAVALKMAQESMVLLKNDGVLPLARAPRRIAVIGPNADSVDALVGNYNGQPGHPVTVLDGIRARFPDAQVDYAPGTGLAGPAEPPVPDGVLCADAACTTPGLKAEHFNGAELAGAPASSTVERNARVDWQDDKRNSSIRWTGFFKAQGAGTYRLRYMSTGPYRIWLGGKQIVDAWDVMDSPSLEAGSATLQAGQVVPIRIEAVQRGARGDQKLVWSPPVDMGQEAVELARRADLVVFVGGLNASLEGEELKIKVPGFNGGDRTSLDLPAPQEQLLERVNAAGKPVVLVLMNGSALSVNWADKHVPAIVEAWYPGGEGGQAVAGLIAGDYSPAGRLPVTFYKSADQLPAFGDYRMDGRTYRYFKGEVLYPFGHGLSYTTFRYATPTLSTASVRAGDAAQLRVDVTVDVANTGKRDGDEVVQLYVEKPNDRANPVLAGMRRVHLKAGEHRQVSLSLDARALSLVDAQGVRKLVPGGYKLYLGGGQPRHAQNVTARLTVTGTAQALPQ
ncbi:glycoside hydrolase family 3 C-terminal domain-containing protein [Massilia sp. 9096]|uniref:glycoside hydrolase family 3 C-terminal domain-containing protein n=1 Tax=Massilia sp. 9096 TaxID=1500894 RepID=UPI001EFB0953|nr:glycoside hydrolase family 3 C-terminal domain-containing protein [Massilia sp. 9096]